MPTTDTLKLIGALLLGAALLFGYNKVIDWKEAAEQNKSRGNTMTATSGILADGAKADAQRDGVDTGIAQGRDDFNNNYQEAKRNEPETAARADRSVPDSVRNAYRARRLARERLGCIGSECVGRPEEEDSAER